MNMREFILEDAFKFYNNIENELDDDKTKIFTFDDGYWEISKQNKHRSKDTIFIDNKIPPGDAIINIKNNMVGPASTITGSFILNSILIEVGNILKNEKLFPFYISVNMPNAKKNNDKLEKKFRKINPHL